MKKILYLLITCFFLISNAQITYEKGYIVDNDNNKIECFIKNSDWKTNPTQFLYKLTENSSEKEGNINTVNEFKIYNTEHYYVKYSLKRDLKDYDLNLLNHKNSFVFLRVLIRGKANLYELNNEIPFFFFQIDNKSIEPLEYRKYVDENKILKEDNYFRKELYENLNCNTFSVNTFSKIKYVSNDLVRLFSEYNKCNKSNYENLHGNRTKAKLNFKLNFGMNYFAKGNIGFSTIYTHTVREESNIELDLQSQTGILFGFETELLLPFNRNKWSLFIAPNYQSYSQSEKTVNITDRFRQTQITYPVTYSANYEFIEIPIGLRYYMNLNANSKLYGQLAVAFPIHLNRDDEMQSFIVGDTVNSSVEVSVNDRNINQSNSSFLFGIGYNLFDKYSIAFNYYFARNFKGSTPVFSSQEGSYNLIASYNIF